MAAPSDKEGLNRASSKVTEALRNIEQQLQGLEGDLFGPVPSTAGEKGNDIQSVGQNVEYQLMILSRIQQLIQNIRASVNA